MRNTRDIILIGLILSMPAVCVGRDVPLAFPPKEGIDPASKERCEKLLDAKIHSGCCYTNVPVDDLLGWFTEIEPGIGITHSTTADNSQAILPKTPDTVTICMTNATFREVLNEVCSMAHLSWRLEPQRRFESGAWIWISICRPERFMSETKNRSWFHDWFPMLFLLAVGSLFLVPILFFSIFPLAVKEDLAAELLGRKYRHLLNPRVKDYFVGQLAGTLLDKFLPVPSDLLSAAWLRHLIATDRKAAVEYAYRILKAKGRRVPSNAWREFFSRNPEARYLPIPGSTRVRTKSNKTVEHYTARRREVHRRHSDETHA